MVVEVFPAITNAAGEFTGGSSGGDDVDVEVINAVNRKSTMVDLEDKVLLQKGRAAGEEYDTKLSTSSNNNNNKFRHIFIDDNTISGPFTYQYKSMLQYIDNAWTLQNIQNTPSSTALQRVVPMYVNNGEVVGKCMDYSSSSYSTYTITLSGYTAHSGIYLGEYNGDRYIANHEADVYKYDVETKTKLDQVITGASSAGNVLLSGNRILVFEQGNAGFSRLYECDSDGVWNLLLQSSTPTANYHSIMGVTGLNSGDYIIMCTNYNYMSKVIGATTDPSYLKLFQIQEDASIVPVSLPLLEVYEASDCRISYNSIQNMLMIGTTSGVFAYKFDTVAKEFRSYPLALNLPELTEGIYEAIISPNGHRIHISVATKDSTYDERSIVISLSDDGWYIVDDKTLNYQPADTCTGKIKEYVGEGIYKVKKLRFSED
jgi:hypothetical protein